MEFDVDRRADYMVQRGSQVTLRVGPFSFWITTADGWAIAFSIGGFGSEWGWSLERRKP